MASNCFEAYIDNLRRIHMAEFIDDHLQATACWRRRIPYRITETTRLQMRTHLTLIPKKKSRDT